MFIESPINMSFVTENLFSPEKIITRSDEIKAPKNPKTEYFELLNKRTYKAIHRPAPDEIPVIYGSASGFLETACINIPANARQTPAITALTALGYLKRDNIKLSVSLER